MASEELNSLIKKRTACNARHTLFKNYIESLNELIANCDIHTVDKAVMIELEIRIGKRELLQEEFEIVQNAIEQLTLNIEQEIKEREASEQSYYQTVAIGKKILSDYSQCTTVIHYKESSPERPTSPGSVHSKPDTAATPGLQNIKLPQIQLPKFNGLYDNWLEFRDTFQSHTFKFLNQ